MELGGLDNGTPILQVRHPFVTAGNLGIGCIKLSIMINPPSRKSMVFMIENNGFANVKKR